MFERTERMMLVGLLAAVVGAPAAVAQETSRGASEGTPRDTDLRTACAELVRGDAQGDERMRETCADLLTSGAAASEQPASEQPTSRQQERPANPQSRQASVTAGEGRGSDVQQGSGVLAAFEQAGRELVNRPTEDLGMLRRGAALNSITTNPIGTFTGQGFNLRYSRAVQDKWALVLGGRYSATDALEGEITAYGLNGGVDYYLLGQNNEGLYAGPRGELGWGSTDVRGGPADDFFRFGLGGEVGYNFIATNGITGGLGFGANARVTGDTDETLDALGDPDLGLYLRLGVGFSW